MSKDVKSPQMGWICAGQKKISGVVERSSYIVSLSWDRRTIVSWLTSMMTGKAPHFHRKSINLTFLSFYIICIGMNYVVVVRSVLKITILLIRAHRMSKLYPQINCAASVGQCKTLSNLKSRCYICKEHLH